MKQLLTTVLLFSAMFCAANNINNSTKESSEEISLISIQGKVIDSNTKESLAGVSIDVSSYRVYTDLDGNFQLNIPSYLIDENIKVSYISYEESLINISNLNRSVIEINQID